MEKNLACCFTGYRPSKFPFAFGEGEEYIKFENKLMSAIFSLPDEKCFTFYTGMAMGFDILAAELVLLLKNRKDCAIELVCVLPFKGQENAWSEEWQERYNKVLESADKVILLSDHYYKGCYFKRNNFMVDNSDIVLTFYDGQTGGTAQTLGYANKKGKKIVNIAEDPENNILFRDYECADLFYIEED